MITTSAAGVPDKVMRRDMVPTQRALHPRSVRRTPISERLFEASRDQWESISWDENAERVGEEGEE